jgi:hypothetical protein
MSPTGSPVRSHDDQINVTAIRYAQNFIRDGSDGHVFLDFHSPRRNQLRQGREAILKPRQHARRNRFHTPKAAGNGIDDVQQVHGPPLRRHAPHGVVEGG